jgi:hypothetical protein
MNKRTKHADMRLIGGPIKVGTVIALSLSLSLSLSLNLTNPRTIFILPKFNS